LLSKRHGRGIVTTADKLSLDDALSQLPDQVSSTFAQFQQQPGATTATTVLEQLNAVYDRALTEKDSVALECEQKKFSATRSLRDARSDLMDVERQLTVLQDRMQALQTGSDTALASVESLRAQYEAHRAMCEQNRAHQGADIAQLRHDLPIVQQLIESVTASCGPLGGSAPALVECAMPDGSFVTTFEDTDTRQLVTSLSSVSAKFVSLNLDRAIRVHTENAGTALLQLSGRGGHRHRRSNGTHAHHNQSQAHLHGSSQQHHGRRSKAFLQSAEKQLPTEEVCMNVEPAPPCEGFADYMGTLAGNVGDLIAEMEQRGDAEDKHCHESLEAYDAQSKDMKRQASDAGVQLANSITEQSELAMLRRSRRAMVKDVLNEVTKGAADCHQQIADLEMTLSSSRRISKDLDQPAGTFLGECEVSDWVRSPCNASCGSSGVQNLTRQVISSAHGVGALCPRLFMNHTCNVAPCPVDAVMDAWDEWSECSRQCGGGTRVRHRAVLTQALHGGLPAAETVQEQLCNHEPCDRDCTLADWSEWGECSKMCNNGHEARTRRVLNPALGDATCPAENDAERKERRPCNEAACPAEPLQQCASKLDLVLVLDSSGSLGAPGFDKIQEFAAGLVGRVQLEEEAPDTAAVGFVTFGSEATATQSLSTERSEVEAAVGSMEWTKSNTNTAQALAFAADMLEAHGRPGVQAVTVLVTDGMPESAALTSTQVQRLKEQQSSRFVVVVVGSSLSHRVAEGWVSWPPEENLLTAPTFEALDVALVTDLIADICPDIA